MTSGDFAAVADLPVSDRRAHWHFRPAARLAGASRLPARPHQPVHGRARQRGLVPQGATTPRGRDPVDRRVLPPAGRHQELEHGLWPWRFPPVPVRRAVRRRRRPCARILERISTARAPSFVTVLKRFGPGDDGYLSFPMPGWTLALDFPARTPGLAGLLRWLDERVLAGGRPGLPGEGLQGQRRRAGRACTRGLRTSGSCARELDPRRHAGLRPVCARLAAIA